MILVAVKGNRETVIEENEKFKFEEDGFIIFSKEEGKDAKLVSEPNRKADAKEVRALKGEVKELKGLLKSIKENYEGIEELKDMEL